MNSATDFTVRKPPAVPKAFLIRLCNLGAICVLAAGLFLLLTNGIPLVGDPLSKKACVKISRFATLGLFGFFSLWAWTFPRTFKELWAVRLIERACQHSLKSLIFFLFVFYAFSTSAVGFMRHWALETRAFDLGIFAQAVWNTLQGDFEYSSIKGGINLLGDHVSPILALLAPFYGLWPNPQNLILIQAVASAACLFLIAYLAHKKLRDSWITLIFALMYFFYYPTRAALHEDFHPEVLAEPFLLAAFIFLERKRMGLFLLSLLVAVAAKENMLGISFALGVYALLFQRRWGLGLVLTIGSLGLFLLDIYGVIPYFSGKPYLYQGNYVHLFSDGAFGFAKALFSLDNLEYFLKVYLPFLFSPFFHLPTLILTLPVLFQNLLSVNDAMHSFNYHYLTGLTPFAFVACIYGFHALCRNFAWVHDRKRGLAVLLLFVALLRSGPAEYFYFADSRSHLTPHREMIRQELKGIPADASVLTHNAFIPQMINRREIYQFDYHAVPTKGESAAALSADYVIFDREFWEPNALPIEDTVQELLSLHYARIYERDGFYIYKKADLF